MAKMQRWRRRGADEEHVEVSDVLEDDTSADDEADVHDDPSGHEDLDTDPAAELDEDPAGDLDEEPVADVDEDLVEDLDEAVDGDPADDLDDEPDDELDEELDEDELDDDLDELPALPHVDDRGRLSRLLLGGRLAAEVTWLQLLQAAHAKQAITTALAVALVAAISGRPPREAGVVLVTVLVGQTMLGWHNDIVDRRRDRAHGLTAKPVAMGRLSTENAWYAIVVAALLLVPLAVTTGIRAGSLYLASVAIGMLGNVVLRKGLLSFWSWAASFALLPAYLSYGGWGGQALGPAPETPIVVLAALLGIGVHFTRSVWGLVADHEDGWTYLPLRLGLKIGATRLLALSTIYTVVIVILLAVVGAKVGLSR